MVGFATTEKLEEPRIGQAVVVGIGDFDTRIGIERQVRGKTVECFLKS